ncbi:MAG: DUF4261 domain-containing protein [Deltaproteobacteria bacterium]|nr:DUF4261 domain-containing protein [Deltaproteobacteria bacterium]
MAKGFFTQGIAVLFDRTPNLDEITAAIGVPVKKRMDAFETWAMSGPCVIVEHDAALNGYVSVDVVDRPWPDPMGDPKNEPMIFGAWSMGHFGPLTYPQSLERAWQHAYHHRESPREVVARHHAFVRVRLSYVFGAKEDAPVIPEGVDPRAELARVFALGRSLLGVEGASLLFVPGADLLFTRPQIDARLADARAGQRLPIDLYSNVRMFRLDGLADGWTMMDTTGLEALDRTDLEVCFDRTVQPAEIASFLRNLSLYVANRGDVFEDGHTIDGPGGRWVARHIEKSLALAPRPVVRFTREGAPLPDALSK